MNTSTDDRTRDPITLLEICTDFAMRYYNSYARKREEAGMHLLSFMAGECNHHFTVRKLEGIVCELCDSMVDELDPEE